MRPKIKICMGSACYSRGNREYLELIESYLLHHSLDADIQLTGMHCQSSCEKGPIIDINGCLFTSVTKESILAELKKLISTHGEV